MERSRSHRREESRLSEIYSSTFSEGFGKKATWALIRDLPQQAYFTLGHHNTNNSVYIRDWTSLPYWENSQALVGNMKAGDMSFLWILYRLG